MEFKPMPKTPRLSREVIVTEKIDGTNASVLIEDAWVISDELRPLLTAEVEMPDGQRFQLYAGSRTRWVVPGDDNYGWAKWVSENAPELAKLGPGHHFGEWWGKGINRNYDLDRRRWSLFNAGRWAPNNTCVLEGQDRVPECCDVVPILYRGDFFESQILLALHKLERDGSVAAPGFMDPEGVMVYHTAAGQLFKKTIKGDAEGKSQEGHVKKERAPKPPRVAGDPNKLGRRKGCEGYAGPFRRTTDKEKP